MHPCKMSCKCSKKQSYFNQTIIKQGQWHRGGHGPPLFWVAKRVKGKEWKKERVSKQKLLKGCHQGENITVLAIVERLQFENFCCRSTKVADNMYFSVFHGPSTLKFISPALYRAGGSRKIKDFKKHKPTHVASDMVKLCEIYSTLINAKTLVTNLWEKCPNTELLLGRKIGKYGLEKTPYLDTFHKMRLLSWFWSC